VLIITGTTSNIVMQYNNVFGPTGFAPIWVGKCFTFIFYITRSTNKRAWNVNSTQVGANTVGPKTITL